MGATPGFDRYIGIDYSGAETPTSISGAGAFTRQIGRPGQWK